MSSLSQYLSNLLLLNMLTKSVLVAEASHFLLQSSGTLFHYTLTRRPSVVDSFLMDLFNQAYMLYILRELFKTKLLPCRSLLQQGTRQMELLSDVILTRLVS